ncbi:serine/threonine protein kinase [Arthrobacter sp. MMS24-S77]
METFAPGTGGQDDAEAMSSQETDPSQPVIPGFVPVRELGRGGSAAVWLATEKRSGSSFAVKCLRRRPEAEDLDEARSSMLREVHRLSRLDHEHLVKVRGVVQLAGAFDGGLGLVMEYAPGGSLGQLLSSRGRLSVGETATILTPLAQALAYLHHQGMTHSDVSPGNVLFTAQGKPLLSDLGVSRMVGDAFGVTDFGTPGFADPGPIVPGANPLLPERDTYALAALGWYCLTGSPPDSAARRPPLTLLVPAVPAALAAAIEAGLHPERRQRPTAAELGIAVYRSAAPAAVDLSDAVHATVVPELLTRRRASHTHARRARIKAFFGRFRPRWGGRTGRPAVALVSVRRRVASIVLAVGTLVVAGSATAVWWAGDRGPGVAQQPQRPAQAPGPEEPRQAGTAFDGVPAAIQGQIRSQNPEEAIRGLAGLRDRAFSTGTFELLEYVNVEGSAAAAADGKVRDGLESAGLVLAGFSTTLINTSVEGTADGDRATVSVTVETSAYEERDASGQVVQVRAAGKHQELRVLLFRGGGEGAWKIAEILAKQS